ncbi:hypothetical protein Y032_0034g2835 [Ancylostoma ceylanicum]|uniref:Uncharacterized protein n=1 Tax=Ancylostoma ceylanicum TaxID=53326 RepID=A0A016UMU0_9BILA|nr:hypothetical protein Y032_0034g2835 [Ancylostoma ceylanicum]
MTNTAGPTPVLASQQPPGNKTRKASERRRSLDDDASSARLAMDSVRAKGCAITFGTSVRVVIYPKLTVYDHEKPPVNWPSNPRWYVRKRAEK